MPKAKNRIGIKVNKEENMNNQEIDKKDDVDEFLSSFDKISEDFDKISEDFNKMNRSETDKTDMPQSQAGDIPPIMDKEIFSNGMESRLERKSKNKSDSPLLRAKEKIGGTLVEILNKLVHSIQSKLFISTDKDIETGKNMSKKAAKQRSKPKKYKINFKQLFKFLIACFAIVCLVLGAMTATVIAKAPKIDPNGIYSLLTENSILYDDKGEILDSVFSANSGLRTNVGYDELPENLRDAFVAIEDKTFTTHKGFNIVRIFGAIKDGITSGRIEGTSTITQQLARNLYLADKKSQRTLTRKIAEAYYTVLLEQHLTKNEILEAYLNTIYLGYGAYGVQAASQAYFSKDLEDLDLIECVALAALPKAPDSFALIKRLNEDDIDKENPDILFEGDDFTYVYNGGKSESRREQILKNMMDQGLITEEEKATAEAEDLKSHIKPSQDTMSDVSSYFADFTINQVIQDLMKEFEIEYGDAKNMVYNNGLRIYTTMNSGTQKIIEKEFSNTANFPGVTRLDKDAAGNILGKNGKVLLYAYENYFNEDGVFSLTPDEYGFDDQGNLLLFKDKRLNFYKTKVGGETEQSIEFKNLYYVQDKVFYSIGGGYILIPKEYKSRDKDDNIVISAEFIEKNPSCFEKSGENLAVSKNHYLLNQKVMQPQSAMVIMDYKTGGIKAMVGGRNTVGRLLYNRANNPRQPGSSIKPIATYGPALQGGYETAEAGQTQIVTDQPGAEGYGRYWTAASVIDDAPMSAGGKQWPKNWYSGYRGLYTLRAAVQQSVNVCAVKTLNQIGPEYSAKTLQKLGVTTVVTEGDVNDMNPAALALGGMSKGISPLEMAGAYGSFPNGGVYTEPISYTKITNRKGEVLIERTPTKTEVFNRGVAFIMTDILRSVVTEGLGRGAAIPNQPVGGKTGTTSDNFDAWFCGFTPQYSAALWIGNDVNIQLTEGSPAAARLWSKVMRQVCSGLPTGSYLGAPDNVLSVAVDTKSGKLPSELSSLDPRGTVRSEYFIKGTVPSEIDDVHTYVDYCTESGYLATPNCPSVSSGFGVKRPYTPNPSVGDRNYEVPHTYCPIHNPDTGLYPIIGPYSGTPYTWEGMGSGIVKPTDPTTDDTTDDGTPGTTPGAVNPGTTVPKDTTPEWLKD